MFTTAKIYDGSTYLSNHLSANDYYCQGEEVQGVWCGKLLRQPGIEGSIIKPDDAVFENLRLNLTPDGKQKLTPRQPTIRFFDFQCAPPKSISVMAIACKDERLREAHKEAFQIAFGELEQFVACRVRSGDAAWSEQNRITSNLCVAVFHHDASRALDPHLHTHAVTCNATYDVQSKRILAITEIEIFKAIRYAGKVYQNELARKITNLGYELETVRNKNREITGFEIKGVSTQIIERFSKRREEIQKSVDQFIAERGHEPTASQIHEIATSTRNPKLKEITTPHVRQLQLDQLTTSEFNELQNLKTES